MRTLPSRKKAHSDRRRRNETKVERVNRGLEKNRMVQERRAVEMAEHKKKSLAGKIAEFYAFFERDRYENSAAMNRLYVLGKLDARRGVNVTQTTKMVGRDGREYLVGFNGILNKWTRTRLK